MHIVKSAQSLTMSDTIISIGNFDGVHLGHQMLLKQMKTEAGRLNKQSVILTFFPPSKHHFTGAKFLSTQEEKLELLERFEPAAVIVIPFSNAYTQTPKEDFLSDIASLSPHTIIVGENFRFGFERKGNLYDLSKHTKRLEVFNLKHGEGQPISSSRIRSLLADGDIAEVNTLLGRNYKASGLVIKGDQRGRTIGFPTANIRTIPDKALPLGVFAVTIRTPQGNFNGMANVGPRPSFPNDPPSLEVFIFDFDTEIYDETVTVSFKHHIRSQRKFSGLDDLKAQLSKDEQTSRTFFASERA